MNLLPRQFRCRVALLSQPVAIAAIPAQEQCSHGWVVWATALAAVSFLLLGFAAPRRSAAAPIDTAELIRERVETCALTGSMMAGRSVACAPSVVGTFYERRGCRPAWTDGAGPLPAAYGFAEALAGATRHGLDPETYHLAEIRQALGNSGETAALDGSANRLADLEILLTDAFLTYAAHLTAGRVNPETLEPDWVARPREADLPGALETALRRNRWGTEMDRMAPAHRGYAHLRDSLTAYRELAAKGGWSVPTGAPTLRRGDRDLAVPGLRHRLECEGYVAGEDSGESFDSGLENAVRAYQARNGLGQDGVVGKATWTALGVPAEARVHQIEGNLERWRWLREDQGQRYLRVNVADFRLEAVEDGGTVLSMPVVVGKPVHRTPVFSGRMTYLVLNPTWNVPDEIADREILPALRRDPGYLARKGFRLLRGWGDDAPEVPTAEVNWKLKSLERAGLRLQQRPGPENPLGRVKFMFPNRFNVYLHDTPSRDLFGKARRDFSHGCIRVERPVDLAEYVLRDDPDWTRETFLAALDTAEERTVSLPEPIPVYVEYFTAWTDEDGATNFRADIYDRDARLEAALAQPVPPS